MSLKMPTDQAPCRGEGGGHAGAWRTRTRGHRVVATGGPGMTPSEPAHRQPRATQAAVHLHRPERVRRARGVVAADPPVERADHRAVGAQQGHEHELHDSNRPTPRARSARELVVRRRRRHGSARTTSTAEPGSDSEVLPGQVSKTALHTIADDGVAHGLAHDQPHLRRLRRPPDGSRGGRRGSANPIAGPSSSGRGTSPHPSVGGPRTAQALTRDGRADRQTARLLRPLRRREERMARPARVRMRRRKPWTLWRRRLFGWYVRLLIELLLFRWVFRLTPGPADRRSICPSTLLDDSGDQHRMTGQRYALRIRQGQTGDRRRRHHSTARPSACG